MRKVAVIGIGQTPVNESWELSLKEIAGNAVFAALQDSGLDNPEAVYVGNMLSGSVNHQQHLGGLVADWVGLPFHEAVRVEAACSSGAAAFRTAVMAVASGDIESAVVVGVEKMTDSPSAEITSHLATAADADFELDMGTSFVALNALIMRRYMHEFGWSHADFAQFSVNAHLNGSFNKNARFQKPITVENFTKAAVVAEPITVMDASPMGDGAAAAVIVPLDEHTPTIHPRIQVAASAAATDTITIANRTDPLFLSAAHLSAKQAYEQAQLSIKDIDLFELHDAFTIMSALSLEACGFAERGKAPRLALDNAISLKGSIPIATRGGLKARGHPVGATGMYQIVEVVEQLRGQAGEGQVEGARIGMAQNIGGSGSNIITHILSRVSS